MLVSGKRQSENKAGKEDRNIGEQKLMLKMKGWGRASLRRQHFSKELKEVMCHFLGQEQCRGGKSWCKNPQHAWDFSLGERGCVVVVRRKTAEAELRDRQCWARIGRVSQVCGFYFEWASHSKGHGQGSGRKREKQAGDQLRGSIQREVTVTLLGLRGVQNRR